MIFPSPGYVEDGGGPIHKAEVAWVEFNGVQIIPRGRLVADLEIDRSLEVIEILKAAGIRWHYADEKVFRIQPSEQRFLKNEVNL